MLHSIAASLGQPEAVPLGAEKNGQCCTPLQPVRHGMGCLRKVTQPRRAHHGEICGGMHVDERDLRTARLPTPAKPPDRPARSPACGDVVSHRRSACPDDGRAKQGGSMQFASGMEGGIQRHADGQ